MKLNDRILKTIGVWFLLICLIAVIACFYYYSTIAAISFWLDQYKLIEFSREILDGKFRLVGMRTSLLNISFPMIHYLLTPLIAITTSPWALYVSTAVAYIGNFNNGIECKVIRQYTQSSTHHCRLGGICKRGNTAFLRSSPVYGPGQAGLGLVRKPQIIFCQSKLEYTNQD